MFDAERLLGGLLRQGLGGNLGSRRRSRRGGGGGSLKSSALLGALGVAVAAFEHYSTGRESGKEPVPPPAPPPPGRLSPPPPPPGARRKGSPPPPPASQAVEAEGSPATARRAEELDSRDARERALLLVRAMVGAAAADGVIDGEEKRLIRERLAEGGLSGEEWSFLEAQLDSPPGVDAVAAEVSRSRDPGALAAEVFAASLIAITADTDAERSYLRRLAAALGLDGDAVAGIEEGISRASGA